MGELARQLKKRDELAKKLFCKIPDKQEEHQEIIRILIVEDDPVDQERLKTFLSEQEKYEVIIKGNGREALECLKNNKFDLIVLDFFLPEMDGIEIYKHFKKQQEYIAPAIMITANNDSRNKAESFEVGIDEYMIKPVDKLELLARVKSLLKSSQRQRSLWADYNKAIEKAVKDTMTGLYNNTYLKEYLTKEIISSQNDKGALTLIMLDLDDFKNYNDVNGHVQGDEALKKTAEIIKNSIRSSDLAARYGGEEFSVVLPSTTIEEAYYIANRIRKNTADYNFTGQEKTKKGNLTISAGVAELKEDDSLYDFLERADKALYEAKRRGKNNVFLAAKENGL
ncbi:Response regulator receiver modulated diguanylate cyclase [Caldisalinibacter kiritimatiensis]|uniref:Response regulator receiver modulated diguanylate cyclase n=2 Tax=Caldisalinibacter kiritimatiensis TaxID=1304284 RepID=R1CKL5_9FIRM|nr:Response regulator receiver modulated diguanylate cyclase [Caldisalinibacter kiritimatiensis]